MPAAPPWNADLRHRRILGEPAGPDPDNLSTNGKWNRNHRRVRMHGDRHLTPVVVTPPPRGTGSDVEVVHGGKAPGAEAKLARLLHQPVGAPGHRACPCAETTGCLGGCGRSHRAVGAPVHDQYGIAPEYVRIRAHGGQNALPDRHGITPARYRNGGRGDREQDPGKRCKGAEEGYHQPRARLKSSAPPGPGTPVYGCQRAHW